MLFDTVSWLYTTVEPYLPVLVTGFLLSASTITSLHIILSRRDPGSSIAWIALVWLAPVLGVISYLLFGINRIQRRAESLREPEQPFISEPDVTPVTPEELDEMLPRRGYHLRQLLPLVERVVERPLLPGNRIKPLFDGDQAYPAMLEAIEQAERSVTLVSYIFDNDDTGHRFVGALEAAKHRGVEVRILIDAAGLRYSIPSIYTRLRRAGVKAARFLPSVFPPHIMSVNLRNHRKIMVVDGKIGFTGGINIRSHHVLESEPSFPARDLHFKVEGPVVAHLQEVFVEDWEFTTNEQLRGPDFFPSIGEVGGAMARGIPDGPDEDMDKLRWTILGAISSAEQRIRIVTPYFIPDPSMVSSLAVAALRGVQVDIILPEVNNLPYVHWASMAHLRPLLKRGCRIFFTPPPFDHSKLMVVDGLWYLLGSANMDPRSLRLNFEFNVECWDPELAEQLDAYLDAQIEESNQITLEEWEHRSRLTKLRDGAAALLSPYL